MGKKLGLDKSYNALKTVLGSYPITGGKFPKGSFMEKRLQLGATSGKKYPTAMTTSVNKGSKLLNIGKKVFSKTPIGRAVNLAEKVGYGAVIGYSYAKNKFKGKNETKVDKKMSGGMMRYDAGGMMQGYGAARTSGMGLEDQSLPPGKMVRANKGKMLSAKQKKIARMAPPPDEITGADFKAMKAKNGKMVKAGLGTFIKDMFGQKQRTASVSPTTDALTGDKNMEVRKIIMNKFKNKMGAKHGKHMKK
jgi:hypothetical protein